jgi:hypothetical protein
MTPSPFLAPDCRHCTHLLLYRSEHLRFAELTRTDRYSQNAPSPAGTESRAIGAECSPPSAGRLSSQMPLARPPRPSTDGSLSASPAAATTPTEPVAAIEVMVGSGTAAQSPQFQLDRPSWGARGGAVAVSGWTWLGPGARGGCSGLLTSRLDRGSAVGPVAGPGRTSLSAKAFASACRRGQVVAIRRRRLRLPFG